LSFLVTAFAGCKTLPPVVRSHAEIVVAAEKAGLKELWHHRVPLLGNEKLVNIWRVTDSIYVTTSNAHLLRYNALTGELVWNIEIGNPAWPIYRPADVPDSPYILVVNRGRGFRIHKLTGEFERQGNLTFAASTDPIVTDNKSFLVGGVESFRSVYLDFGGTKWNVTAPGNVFTVRPALEGEAVFISSEQGRLWRVNTYYGEWTWKDRIIGTGSRVVGGIAADSRAVYVPALDGKVFAFDMTNGTNIWTKLIDGANLNQDLLCTRSDLLVPATGRGIYNLSTATGDVKWFAPGIAKIGTIIRDRIWASDRGGNIHAISLNNGERLASTNVGGSIIYNNVDNLVLTVTPAGEITAYTANR